MPPTSGASSMARPRAIRTGPVASAYRRALLEARRRGFAQGREGVARLRAAFREAARAVGRDEATGAITPFRAAALRRELREVLHALEGQVVGATQRAVTSTVADVSDVHARLLRRLARQHAEGAAAAAAIERAVSGAFEAVPARAVAAITARRANAATFRTLVHRNVLEAIPDLDRLIESGVARGVSSAHLTTDIAHLLAGGDSAIAPGAGFDLGAYGFGDPDVSGVRTLLYDARRIAVTETNNALREANTQSLVASPVVLAVRWQLSGRHEAIGIWDECDELATVDAYGYGAGFYPPDRYPLAPHPFCACTQGEILFRDPSEWGEAKPASPGPLGAFDHTARPDGVSEAQLDAVRRRTAAIIRRAA